MSDELSRAGRVFIVLILTMVFGGILTTIVSLTLAGVGISRAEIGAPIGIGITVAGAGLIGLLALVSGIVWIFEQTPVHRQGDKRKRPRSGGQSGLYR